MSFPQEFYFSDIQQDEGYRATPPGNLIVNRLINNKKDYWQQLTPVVKQKQKTLFFSDWTCWSWSDKKIEKVKKKLSQLLDEGFDLYFYEYGTIKKITKADLTFLDLQTNRENFNPTLSEKIKSDFIRTNPSFKKEIHILDDYWIDYLIQDPDTVSKRTFHLSKAIRNLEEAFRISEQADPPLSEIIYDFFAPHTNLFVEDLDSSKSSLVSKKIGSLSGDTNLLKTLLTKGQIGTPPTEFTLADLQNLETIYIDQGDMSEEIIELLGRLPNLKKYKSQGKHQNLLNAKVNLPQLEILELEYSDINGKQLYEFVSQAPKLKKLNLRYCNNLHDKNDLPFALEALEKLDALRNPSITNQFLYQTHFKFI